MTNRNNKGDNKIKLNDDEFNKILKLYQIALNATSKASLSSGGSSISGNIKDKDIAWYNLQKYMNELGKKYGFNPKEYIINKNTKELEEYSVNN